VKILPRNGEEKMTKLKTVWVIMTWGLILGVFFACTLPTKKPPDPLTPTEQLLFSKAIKRGLQNFDLGIPKETAMTLDVSRSAG